MWLKLLKSLARRKRFELLTPRFEVCTKCLILLGTVENSRPRGTVHRSVDEVLPPLETTES
jgi:hypothetical protein